MHGSHQFFLKNNKHQNHRIPFPLICYYSSKCCGSVVIGKRSEPPSDKLGGEIFIATCAIVCIYLYIYAYGLMTVPCPRYMLRAQRGHL